MEIFKNTGGNIPDRNFLGGHFSGVGRGVGGVLVGGNFPGGDFPSGSIPDTVFKKSDIENEHAANY